MHTYLLKEPVNSTATADADANSVNNRKKINKNCARFTDCKSAVNNVEIHGAKDIDIALPRYNLIEYSDSYSKTSGRL